MMMYAGVAMTALAMGTVLVAVLTGRLNSTQENAEQVRVEEQNALQAPAGDGSFDTENHTRVTQ
ncbi:MULTISPECIES: hypothetical protein [Actinoalloteichus]|uniref:Uncharacterized protein n=1 Tax=Actinoalloteichus fjordicus TaxID=1612552 RepID=A0AAC9PVJ4_9PSEU|nr:MULTISPECIES: hypothetical protein [Actinoalloteichus]APU17961.1 hypothetical protein UA74_29850 [Actinoalloteichus fjordicus]APU24040.1 hypothetical protein UA75_30385 [Actinoalloteichus sp. GBA129-24]